MEQLNEEFCALIHDANTNERDVLRFIIIDLAYHIIAGVLSIIILATTMHMSSRNLL